jgi:endogenous inhibitor of DNA gyrase (YacG/DUF329 family)
MIRCPICKKEVASGSPDFPFCCERCRLIDLGKWASEDYRIPGAANPQPSHEDADDE